MPDEYRQPRRTRKKWSAKRWRFELKRIGLLLALILLVVLLVRGCGALFRRPADDSQTAPTQTEQSGTQAAEAKKADEAKDPPAPLPTMTERIVALMPPPRKKPQEITLVMVGDVLLHLRLSESGLQEDGTYNYDHFFAHTKDLISAADLALVNQEVILGGRELGLSGYPAFNGAYEVGDALVNAGFDVVLHATNHALDKVERGLNNCLNFWRTNHPDIAVLGIHDSQESQDTVYVYEQGDARIAILNYTYGTNGYTLPHPYSVDLLEEDRVVSDLQWAEENADFTVVVPHWGTEYHNEPDEMQRKWTALFLENGADLVIGCHPHVIQPVEWVEDDAGHRMLVYYSLGNFINFSGSSGEGKGQRALGAMATVTLYADSKGEVTVSDYGVIPLVCHMEEGRGKPTVYPLSEYPEELLARNAMTQKDPTFDLDYCRELCREVFGDLYQE